MPQTQLYNNESDFEQTNLDEDVSDIDDHYFLRMITFFNTCKYSSSKKLFEATHCISQQNSQYLDKPINNIFYYPEDFLDHNNHLA